MPSKLLHLLGGGLWQAPTAALAKSMGYRVLVTDVYSDRPAYEFSDYHEVVDIRDRQETLTVAERYGIDGILCVATDVGVPTAAFVAERMGLPGPSLGVAEAFTFKDRMRRITQGAGVPSPAYRVCESLGEVESFAAQLGRAVILKPVDSQSSRGVRRVEPGENAESAFHIAMDASLQRRILAEEALAGTELTVEAIVSAGVVHTVGISDKSHFKFAPQVASRLTYPADLSSGQFEKVSRINEAAVAALGLQNGVTHAEYFIEGDSVSLVEIAARGGGSGIYSYIMPYLSGVDVPRQMIELALGDRSAMDPPVLHSGKAANLEFFSFPSGTVQSISGVEQASALPGVEQLVLEFKIGDRISMFSDDRSRPGFVIVLGNSRGEVLSITDHVKSKVSVYVRP